MLKKAGKYACKTAEVNILVRSGKIEVRVKTKQLSS